jgi:hypothetical protein
MSLWIDGMMLKILVLLFVLMLLVGCFVAWMWRLAKRGTLQFSLRGFLIMVALIALILATVMGYRGQTMARTEWIPAGSIRADKLFPADSISSKDDGKYQFTYFSKRCSIQKLAGPINQVGNMSFRIDRESIAVTVEDEATAIHQLAAIKQLDVVPQGTFVIRGKVVDRSGAPLAGATVDLMGRYVFINYFQTRNDGTFTMPLTGGGSPPAGSGYYLCVRAKEETAANHIRWNTASFSLTPNDPEMVVLITVPAN